MTDLMLEGGFDGRRHPDRHRKRVAILQSNYVPWIGYFDLIASADEFIFYDEAQYTKGDWRNRNRIKTPQGVQWLTIPVAYTGKIKIAEVAIADPSCGLKHWKTLTMNYTRAPFFRNIAGWLQPLYAEEWTSLSSVNQLLINAICRFLEITTTLTRSTDYILAGDRNGRLIALCRQAGAGVYLSGPSAASYLDVEAFEREGIEVEWMKYPEYPAYPQLWGGYEPGVSILDRLFNCGSEAADVLRHQPA